MIENQKKTQALSIVGGLFETGVPFS